MRPFTCPRDASRTITTVVILVLAFFVTDVDAFVVSPSTQKVRVLTTHTHDNKLPSSPTTPKQIYWKTQFPTTPAWNPTSSRTLHSASTVGNNNNNSNNNSMNQNNNKLVQILQSTDTPLLIYFALWYLGNYYYKISNKRVLMAAGGTAGFPLTISSLQLAIGSLYGIFLWMAPDARNRPKLTRQELLRLLPLAFCYAATHCASCFSFAAGSVSFAEIVKAGEPVFAAVLAQFVYQRKISRAKWMCLPLIIGGVILAAVQELDFAMTALVSACLANLFAAVRSNENKKFIEGHAGLKERMGCVGNQFALTSILGFFTTIPFLILKEGSRFGEFCTLVKTSPVVKTNLIASALWFYGYNELSTMTLKKTGPVTQSVANTAKRIIVIIGSALVFKEAVTPLKALGCAIGIGGVFLYSCIDQLFPPKKVDETSK